MSDAIIGLFEHEDGQLAPVGWADVVYADGKITPASEAEALSALLAEVRIKLTTRGMPQSPTVDQVGGAARAADVSAPGWEPHRFPSGTVGWRITTPRVSWYALAVGKGEERAGWLWNGQRWEAFSGRPGAALTDGASPPADEAQAQPGRDSAVWWAALEQYGDGVVRPGPYGTDRDQVRGQVVGRLAKAIAAENGMTEADEEAIGLAEVLAAEAQWTETDAISDLSTDYGDFRIVSPAVGARWGDVKWAGAGWLPVEDRPPTAVEKFTGAPPAGSTGDGLPGERLGALLTKMDDRLGWEGLSPETFAPIDDLDALADVDLVAQVLERTPVPGNPSIALISPDGRLRAVPQGHIWTLEEVDDAYATLDQRATAATDFMVLMLDLVSLAEDAHTYACARAQETFIGEFEEAFGKTPAKHRSDAAVFLRTGRTRDQHRRLKLTLQAARLRAHDLSRQVDTLRSIGSDVKASMAAGAAGQ